MADSGQALFAPWPRPSSPNPLATPGGRGKHIDPSVRSRELGKPGLPVSAKLGIDATIPEGVPRAKYERVQYFLKDRVRLEDYT